MKGTLIRILYLLCFFISFHAIAQPDRYILNGSANRNSCNCYTITTELRNQSGSVWNKIKINLSDPFDFAFNVNLGCIDANGADGIVFILQPISTSIGTTGEGMGFSGVSPSIGIALDTWQNSNLSDPDYDHISIQANGLVAHTSDLTPLMPISSTSNNVEDCNWHVLRISWDPATKWLQTYFDGTKRVEVQKDLVKDIFNNDPQVYWGFSGATGGSVNLQQFCTALNPKFVTDASSNAVCIGKPISFKDQSESFAPITNYYWDFGDGTTSTDTNPPAHVYSNPGNYTIRQVITGKDGCISDTLKKTILVGSYPNAGFDVFDTCYKTTPRVVNFSDAAFGVINQWDWKLDGASVSSLAVPSINASPGSHQLSLSVTTNAGCTSTPSSKNFVVKDFPLIEAVVKDGCLNDIIPFEAKQLDNKTTIDRWKWNFNDGTTATQAVTEHSFGTAGNKTINLQAHAANGCATEISKEVLVNKVVAFAGNDSVVGKSSVFSLIGTGQQIGTQPLSFSWQPASMIANANDPKPSLSLEDDQSFLLTVKTAEGCEAVDSVKIFAFKGAAIYVPNAFTPNNDGRNDLLRPLYLGIKKLYNYSIYNRWGELVFTTTDLSKGWNGTYQNKSLALNTFVWFIKAEDFLGNMREAKGTVTLLR